MTRGRRSGPPSLDRPLDPVFLLCTSLVLLLSGVTGIACKASERPVTLPATCGENAVPTPTSKTTLALSWFVSADVEAPARSALRAPAAALWSRYGVELRDEERRPSPFASPFAEGQGRAEEALAPLFSFVRARAKQPGLPEGVDVVVLERLARRGSTAERFFAQLDGLTFSPAHRATLAQAKDPGAEPARALYDALDLPQFRPTVLVSVDKMRPLDLRLAHELGHALGLDHVVGDDNLMATQRRVGCAPVLDDRQLTTVRATLGARTLP